jgi:Flp pilus assembly protein TadG
MTPAKILKGAQNEKGVVIIVIALLLPILIGFCALVVDLGYLYVAKGELQNAADAGALAGAKQLYDGTTPTLHWTDAPSSATTLVQQNKVAGTNLSDATVDAGYWSITQTPAGMQSQAITPTVNDVPAVRVTVNRAAGVNGGALPTYFAKIFGVTSVPLTASAVAGVTVAGSMTGSVLPISLSQAYVNANPLVGGQSGTVTFSPDNSPTTSHWTTLEEGFNGANVTRDLTDPSYVLQHPVSIGDTIQGSTGIKATLYNAIADHAGTVMYLPVVDNFTDNKVVGFVALRISSSTGTSTKTVVGNFVGPVETSFAAGVSGGTGYGVYTLPKLLR